MSRKKRRITMFFVCLAVLLLPASVKASANHTQSEAVSWASAQIGKGLDYDKQYGNQCVDLIKYYYEYLGHAGYAMGNANAYAANTLPPGWQRVYGNYQPGDIAVWKVNHSCSTCSTSALGHVGIIMSADSVGFNAINQNFGGNSTCTQNWFYVSALQCAIRPDFKSVPSDTQPPVISNVTVTDVTREGYTVNCTVTDNVGVTSVQFPSWNSDVHGGSDAVWLNGAINGNTASVRVNLMDLKAGFTEGNYMTHIYVYDAAGNYSQSSIPWVYIDRTAPVISEVEVDLLTKDQFRVSCKIEDNVENNIDRIQFPAWTLNNGQDDLVEDWQTNPGIRGEGGSQKGGNGRYTFFVKSSDHGGERGLYRVHIYAFDKYGNMSSYSGLPDVEMPDDAGESPDTPKPDTKAFADVNIWFYNQYAQAYQLLEQLNRLRASAGTAPLTMDGDLLKAAMDRAAECQVSYAHTRPDGTDYTAVLPGLEHTAHAENIFCAENGDISAIEYWNNIPQDNWNMINSAYTRAGVGCVYQRENDTHTWILLLADGTANPVSKTGEEFVKKTVSALPENLNLQMLERSRAAKVGDTYDFVLLNKLWTGGFWVTCVIDPDDVSITSSNPNVIGADLATGKITALSGGTSNITLSLKTDSRISVSGTYTVTPASSGQTPDQNQTPDQGHSPSGPPQTPQPNHPGYLGQHSQTPAVSKPSRVTIKNVVSKSKGKAAVSWKKVSRASGYQIRYSVKGNMKSCKMKKAAGANKTSAVLKGLKKGKYYYIQVRAYRNVSGRTYYGSWSSKRRVKIKK